MRFVGDGGEWIFQSPYSQTFYTTVIENGTVRTNNQDFTLRVLTLGGRFTTGALYLGTSTVSVIRFDIDLGNTFDAGQSTIRIRSAVGRGPLLNTDGGVTFHDVIFVDSTVQADIRGDNSYRNVTLNGPGLFRTGATYESLTLTPGKVYEFDPGTVQTITTSGTLNAIGTPALPIEFKSTSPGTRSYFSKDGATICLDYLIISDNEAQGSAAFIAGPHSTNVSNNLGWSFDFCTPPQLAGCVLDSVCFDTLALSNGSWNWNFDDTASGQNNTSQLPDPCHVFSSPGSYNVYVDVMTLSSSDRVRATVEVNPAGSANCRPLAEIPTLSEWGLILLGLLMVATGSAWMWRRRWGVRLVDEEAV